MTFSLNVYIISNFYAPYNFRNIETFFEVFIDIRKFTVLLIFF